MKLIDKDAVVAEIERELKNVNLNYVTVGSHPSDSDTNKKLQDGISKNLQNLLSFLNTLELKEVDLEEEAELIANDIMIGVQANRYNTVVYNTKRCDFNHSHLMLAVRKGIELGLRAQKGE